MIEEWTDLDKKLYLKFKQDERDGKITYKEIV